MELVNGIISMSLLEICTSSSTLTAPLSMNLIKQSFALTKLHLLQLDVKEKMPSHSLYLPQRWQLGSTLSSQSLSPTVNVTLHPARLLCNTKHYLHLSALNQVVLSANNSPSHPLYMELTL